MPAIKVEKYDHAVCPIYRLKRKYPFPFSVSCYLAVQIKSCLKSTSVIKVATKKKYGRFPLRTEGSHQRATTKSTLFTVSKDERNTKEGTVKSIKNVQHVLWYAKRHLLD